MVGDWAWRKYIGYENNYIELYIKALVKYVQTENWNKLKINQNSSQ